MKNISKILSGGIFLAFGIYLNYKSFLSKDAFFPVFLTSLFFIIAGIFILINNKENEIEKIKYKKELRRK